MFEITTEMMDLANTIRAKIGLCDLRRISTKDFSKVDAKDAPYIVYSSDDLSLITCMYASGSVLHCWGYVYLIETPEQFKGSFVKGKYALVSEERNWRLTDKLSAFKSDFLAGFKTANLLNNL